MSRGRHAGRRAPADRSRAPRGPGLAWVVIAASLAVAAFAAANWWTNRAERPPSRPPASGTGPWGDAADGVGPVEAYARGIALTDSGLSRASLPYLYRAISAPGAPWQAWRAYGSALHNVAMATAVDPLSSGEHAPRSSFERIALERMSLQCLQRAGALADSSESRAIVLLTRGQFLRTWGMPWDALHDFHDAGQIAAHWADMAPYYAKLMLDPLRPDPRREDAE